MSTCDRLSDLHVQDIIDMPTGIIGSVPQRLAREVQEHRAAQLSDDDARALRIGRAVQGCRYDPVHQRVIFPDGTWAATAQGLHAALLAAGEATDA